jgi:Putative Flp pilus-assembly TadE/G-like
MITRGTAMLARLLAHDRRPRGQIIVIVAIAMVAMLAAVALVIDGGNAYAQQRKTQNGVDATAEAGATQLARWMTGVFASSPSPDAAADAAVQNAISVSAAANNLGTVESIDYTDVAGTILGPVGGGTIPANTQGVRVGGSRSIDTYVGGIVGIKNWKASAEATAITGFAEDSGFGGLVPLTFPILLTECESGGGSNKIFFPDDGITDPPDNPAFGTPWPFGPNNLIAIPLCSNGPGNVGWIDWDSGGGGVAQLDRWITGVDKNPPITTPHWYEVTETGGKTALDAPMDTLEGHDITIPIFHAEADNPSTPQNEELIGTCDAAPANPRDSITDCPTPDIGANGNGWYFLETFGTFHLEHSYIQGSHQAECNDPSLVSTASPPGTRNPENNCLIGYFKDKVVARNMTVGSGTATSEFTPLAIQLIH